ncbi:DNA internalization-related competence protein ComEC/Rec2 [Marinobacter sp. AL4B]|uniref:DNA internalization-related competence protein ComEC/Rec2 n=1 Tax=Marinobacter sp. AL4B TaxID=2871173 RepID=UPI001CAA7BED|nr:DNA internalization-related competence protein ComEC/Rec2 [Marinobacter sp. AL4B]
MVTGAWGATILIGGQGLSRNTQFSTKAERSLLCPLGVFAFSCGVILLYRFSVLPPYPWLFSSLFVLPLLFKPETARFRVLVLGVIWLATGLGWTAWHADARLQEQLTPVEEGVPITLFGYACDLPQPGSFNSIRFNFCVDRWPEAPGSVEGGARPHKIRLAWYGSSDKVLPSGPIALQAVLKRPHGSLNDVGFRYEDWLFRHGVGATGSVRNAMELPDASCGLACSYHVWHRGVASAVERHFGDAVHYPLVASLLIGNRGHLSAEQWQTLKATGTIHLVAISGLHLGLVALIAGLVVRRLLLILPAGSIPENVIRNTVYCAVLLACLFYALLAGMTVPTRRALLMVVVGGWFLLKAREVSPWWPFVIAMAGVLLLDPFAPLDQGFWLSFSAVALLIWVFANRLGRMGWLSGLLLAQCAVFAGLWPVLQSFDQTQPLAGVLANLVAIPWVSFVVMPVLFAGTLLVFSSGGFLTVYVVKSFDAVLGVLWGLLQGVAALPIYPLPGASPIVLVAFVAVVLLLLRFPSRSFRALSSLVFLGWLVFGWLNNAKPENPSVEFPEVRIWDVGQGLSVLVRSENQVLMYDTGPEVKGVYSAAESVLLPNLKALGVNQIDHLVVSHGDSDHSGGLDLLMNELSIKVISTGEPEVVQNKMKRQPAVAIQPCPRLPKVMGAFELNFWRSPLPHSGNDASCVLRLFHRESGVDLLLTGDIGGDVESEMLADAELAWLSAFPGRRILVAPHHGSKTSSSMEWVRAVKPNWVIYTAGYRHRYGHPHRDVVSRYRQVDAVPLNSACSGQLSIRFEAEGPKIIESKHNSPFWIAGRGLTRDQCKIP